MLKLFLISLVFPLTFRSQDIQMESNKEVRFSVWRTTEERNGFIVSTKNIIQTSVLLDSLGKNEIFEIIQFLNDDQFDFAANIYLYSYSKREATSIFGFFMSDFTGEQGKYVHNTEKLKMWKAEEKQKEIKYWKDWFENKNWK